MAETIQHGLFPAHTCPLCAHDLTPPELAPGGPIDAYAHPTRKGGYWLINDETGPADRSHLWGCLKHQPVLHIQVVPRR